MSELYSLPDGWEWKKLDDFVSIKGGKRIPKGKKLLETKTNYPYIRVTDFNDFGSIDLNNIQYITEDIYNEIKNYIISKDDIYISIAGTIGKTGIIPNELDGANLTENAAKFVFDDSKYGKFFWLYFTNSIPFLEQIGLATKTVAMPKLALTRLKEVEIPLPPFEEQKRIVAKLDILFEKIDKAIALHQKNIDEADIFMASVLNDVFIELEEKYPLKKVSDGLKNILTGTTPPTKEEKYYNEPSINWYSPSDFGKSKVLSLSKNMINSIALTDKKAKIYEKNTLLLVAIGATVGKIGVIKEEASSNQQITAMKFKDDIDVDFSYYWFYYIKQIIINTASAATLPIINQSAIKDLKFIIPPLQTQQKVVSYLDEISNKMEKIKNLQKKKMQSLKELKASILDKAFKGEL